MTRHFSHRWLLRALVAQFVCMFALLAGLGAADAAILVNKAFSPTSVALGGTSTVTVTLQNTSTLNTATVTSFTDDIATMGGTATIASPSGLATTCAGGNASISGTVVTMSAGTIPAAPSTTVSGTCTITFNVVGAVVGNGVNSIAQGALTTSQGSNGTSASQTLQVTGLAPTLSGSATTTVTTESTATNVFTINNPDGAALTNVVIPIVGTANSAFAITTVTVGGGAGCSGTETFPAATPPGENVTVTIPSFPANTSCAITLTTTTVSQAAANTVTYTIGSTSITDDQGVTNSGATTTRAAFITGRPTVSKAFNPATVAPGGTTTLTIRIANIETQALTTVNVTDALPAYLTIDAAPNVTYTNCGAPANASSNAGVGIGAVGTVRITGATVAAATTLGTATAASTCTITILLDVNASAPSVVEQNAIPAANLTDDQNLPAANNATANITITSTGIADTKGFSAGTIPRLTPDRLTLTFTNAGATTLTNGTFTDNLPQTSTTATALPMAVDITTTPLPTYSASCGTAPAPTTTYGNYIAVDPTQNPGQMGPTVVTGSGLMIAPGATCTVTFNIVLTNAGGIDTNTLLAADVSFDSGGSTIHAGQNVSANVGAQTAFVTSNYVASNAGLENQPLSVQAAIVDRAAAGVTESNIVATFALNPNAATHKVMLAAVPSFTFSGGCASLTAANIIIGTGGESFTVNVPTLSSTCRINYNVINEQTGAAGAGTFGPGNGTYTSTESGTTTTTTGPINNVTFYTTSIIVNKTFSPNTITAGATSNAAITLRVNPVSGLGTTIATGVGFVDSLPANLFFAPTVNLNFSGCGASPNGVIAGTQLTVSGVTLTTVGTSPTLCTVSFDTTSTTLGNVTNSIPAHAITSDSGASNTQAASASLSISAGVSLQKTFVSSTFPIGSTNIVRFLITNSASSTSLSSGTLTDMMPTSLVLASLTPPANQAGDPPSCGGTITGPVGSSTFHITGMTVGGVTGGVAAQCVQYVLVTTSSSAAPGSVSNTISAGALVIGSLTNVTGSTGSTTQTPAPPVTIAKGFAPASVPVGGSSVLTITVTNTAANSSILTAASLTDTLPANVVIGASPNASTTCGSGTVTAVSGSSSVALSGGTIAANSSCTIAVTVTSLTPGDYTNTIAANALTTTQGSTNTAPATAPLTVTAPGVVLSKAFLPANIAINGVSVLTLTIANTASGSLALTNLALTDALPANITIAATPAASTTCAAGSVAAAAGGPSVALSGASLAAGATCTISVSVTSGTAGSYLNTVPPGSVTSTQGATNAAPATAPLVVAAPNVGVSKAFSPNTIVTGATSVLTITVANAAAGSIPLSGVSLTDTLPANVTFAATPNASTTCAPGTVVLAGSTLNLINGSLAAGATCTVTVTVTSSTVGSYTNTIPAGTVVSAQGASNGSPATAVLNVYPTPAVTIAKAFTAPSFAIGSTAIIGLIVSNTASAALSGGTLTDAMPSALVLASTTAPTSPPTAPLCGATITGTIGASTYGLTGISVPAASSPTIPGQCEQFVLVTSSPSAAPGSVTNTILTGGLVVGGLSNTAPASASIALTAPPAPTVAKAFSPASIPAGGTSMLTVAITNAAANAAPLSGIALTDSLPSGVTIAATANAATTCPSGTVGATAGSGSLSLSGATLAVNASCTFSASVTSNAANTYTNTIAANALTTTQGATNASPATANLTVTAGSVTLTKAFAPATIAAGGTSVLTLTIANTATGAVALTNLTVNDNLPIGVTTAAIPNPTTTCGVGTFIISNGPGGTDVTMGNGSLAAGASCTVSVSVTSTTVGSYVNSIPAGAVSDTQGASNTVPANATLTVIAPDVTLTKTFTPATIAPNGSSTVTLTVANTAANNVALTGLGLNDALPAGVTIAATPNAATTCGAGTVTAAAGSAAVSLSGGAVASGATCTISVAVTASTPGSYVNTVAAGNVTSTQGASNGAPASATLTVANATSLSLTKAFAPAAITTSGTSSLTLTIANTGAGATVLTGIAVSDLLPAGVTIAAGASSTTCGAGTVTATTGATSLSLSGGSVGAGATCTVTVQVTSSTPGSFVNTIAAGALTSTQGSTNAASATATLAVTAPNIVLSKAFAPATIVPSGTSVLTITLANTAGGNVALSGLAVTDGLPAGVTIAAAPNASTTCGAGTVAATAGAASVALSNGSVASGATCTISVSVTASIAGSYVNTIAAGSVTSTQGASNAAAAVATLTVANAPPVSISKAFLPTAVAVNGTSVLTISIANTAAGAVALTGLAIADALPSGVTIAAVPNASTTCGAGTVAGPPGGANLSLSGGTLAAGATCTITASVVATTPGAHVNTVPTGAVSSTQGASNTASATATLTASAANVTLSKAFSPTTIVRGATSQLTIAIANTGSGAGALSNVALSDTLPAGITLAAAPNASTTCAAGTVSAAAGATSLSLSGAAIAAGVTCTITVSVTGTMTGIYTNTIPAGALTSTEGASNTSAAVATLTIVNAPGVVLSKAFAPASISVHGVSQLTITIANTATGAVALTALGVSDTLPAGVTIAPAPAASTTCGAGTVAGASGAATLTLSNGTLAAGATCSVTISVTAAVTGSYVNTIAAGAVTSAQGASNATAATATLTVVTASLSVTKTSNPSGSVVSPGQRITYTIAIANNGGGPETNATLTDMLTNATLVPGSVTVNGAAAPDSVVTGATPFGTIAAGTTATIVYAAIVNANAPAHATVTNNVTAGGDQPCTGASCSAVSPPNTITAPTLSVVKTIDGQTSVGVAAGQTVTYVIAVTNTGAVPAESVVVTDAFPAGATPIAGSVLLNGAPAAGATVVGQMITVPVGDLAAAQTSSVSVRATISTVGSAIVNVANASAIGLAGIGSNPATASVGSAQLIVDKTADAAVVRVGDRVDYTITVRSAGGLAYGLTTIVDTLPAYEAYAPGTGRINGKLSEPTVHGRTLTWTVPALPAPLTLTYAVAILPGAPQNGSLTNVVNVAAVGPGGGAGGVGTASSSITVVASTFGSCYPITGRVYVDTRDRGRFEPGDAGIGGVRVYLDDGESVETDAQGRYNFPCVRPGMHAMRLDTATLPAGTAAFDDRRLDSERSTRRLVHTTFDTTIIQDVNFAVRDTHAP